MASKEQERHRNEVLINLVRNRPILFAKKSRDYRQGITRCNTWVEVAKETGEPSKFLFIIILIQALWLTPPPISPQLKRCRSGGETFGTGSARHSGLRRMQQNLGRGPPAADLPSNSSKSLCSLRTMFPSGSKFFSIFLHFIRRNLLRKNVILPFPRSASFVSFFFPSLFTFSIFSSLKALMDFAVLNPINAWFNQFNFNSFLLQFLMSNWFNQIKYPDCFCVTCAENHRAVLREIFDSSSLFLA